jgi:putative ABC transport system ATP-binding protein
VLRGVDLEIRQGEFVAIMGPSGSGKSTLLNVLGLLDDYSAGIYLLDGMDVAHVSELDLARARREKFGFVFQLFNLVPRLSALRNVELPMIYSGISAAMRRKRAIDALTAVGLQDRIMHSPASLSGGQQQRVAIARAIVCEPPLLIADEPTGSLDTSASEEVLGLLCDMHRAGKTVVMVTHDHDVARRAQRTIQVVDGRILKAT